MAVPMILISYDAAFMRKMIRLTLAEAGFTNIVEADNGNKAVEIYKEEKPSLVLRDITMAGKDGLSTLKDIIAFDAQATVIICSASGQAQTDMNATHRGAMDDVVKPFPKDKLIETVQDIL